MKDSQRIPSAWTAQDKYIKESNERFSTQVSRSEGDR